MACLSHLKEFFKNMEYQEYLKQIKNKISKLTITQRVAVAILLLLIVVAGIYAMNPRKKLIEMRNSQRRSDVVNILNAVYEYSVANNGSLPESITAAPTMICRDNATSCEGLVDLSNILKDEKRILSKVPVDPKVKEANISGYKISRLPNGRITITAPFAENNAVIGLTK